VHALGGETLTAAGVADGDVWLLAAVCQCASSTADGAILQTVVWQVAQIHNSFEDMHAIGEHDASK
jgi:hypothetical protein